MKQSASIDKLGRLVGTLLRRYHIIIFALTIVIGVSVAVFFLNNLITASSQADPPAPISSGFNKETIDAINKFDAPGTNREMPPLPSGRINPFIE